MEEDQGLESNSVVGNSDNIAKDKVGQEQIHDLLFKETLSWRSIIYDLINSEQLNPWDIDIGLLSGRYLEKIRQLEEANFHVSSQVLLAAALLLRIKSEILLNDGIKSIDEILYGKEEERVNVQERLELDEEIPGLVPRTPLPRFRKVTLPELMAALGKAIKTESRRIKKHLLVSQFERETQVVMPRGGVQLKERIKDIFTKIQSIFTNRETKVGFSELLDLDKGDKLSAFVSLLHLDNQQRVWLEQEGHFDEIWILLKDIYVKNNKDKLEQMQREVEEYLANEKLDDKIVVESDDGEEDLDEVTGFGNKVERKAEG